MNRFSWICLYFMEFLEYTEVYVLQFEIANQAKDDWFSVGLDIKYNMGILIAGLD